MLPAKTILSEKVHLNRKNVHRRVNRKGICFSLPNVPVGSGGVNEGRRAGDEVAGGRVGSAHAPTELWQGKALPPPGHPGTPAVPEPGARNYG